MMDIIFAIIGLTFPIFYIWGAVSAFQKFFGKKKIDESAHKLLSYLFQRAEDNPELTLQDFLAQAQGEELVSIQVPVISKEVEPVSADDEEPQRLGDLVATSSNATITEPTKSKFSWSEWYADHSIDFILYLGAFMIVAAVTLFVGFQWENFGGVTRFGIVLAFTIAWYVAGIAVQRVLSLDAVGIAFITIGAILTPFCGVAWQQFVVGSLDNVGITWLITSVIGTIIYMALSLIYQRRHFTYFGNLSILATILSFVELNSAPEEYFILAANITALILLIGRVAIIHLAPQLEEYLGKDFERSSLVILIFSLIAGGLLLPTTSIPIASIQVIAVMVSTLLYMCLYTWLNTNVYSVVFTQVFAIATLTNLLATVNLDALLTLYIALVAHLGLQFVINQWLEGKYPEIYFASNAMGLGLTGIIYLMSIGLSNAEFWAIPTSIIFIAHSAYFATRLEKPLIWYITAIMCYFTLTHILLWLRIDDNLWITSCIVLGAVQLAILRTNYNKAMIHAFAYTSLVVLSFLGFASLGLLLDNAPTNILYLTLLRLNPFISLGLISIAMLADKAREDKIFHNYMVILLASVSILYYLASTQLDSSLMAIGFALSGSVMFWIASDLTKRDDLYFVVFFAPYVALSHILDMFRMPLELYPIAYSVLSLIFFFASSLPDNTKIARKLTPLLALVGISIWAFGDGVYSQITMHFAGWVSSYTFIVLLWMSEDILGKFLRNVLFIVAVLVQYFWHIIFFEQYINAELFNDIQWYSAAVATVLFLISINMIEPQDESDTRTFALQFVASIILIFPTLGQIIYESSFLYFILGVIYSLIIGAIAITFKETRTRTLSAIALVLVVLFQSQEFLINLPRWVVIGIVGFGLIGAGLYLSIRRRNVKNEA